MASGHSRRHRGAKWRVLLSHRAARVRCRLAAAAEATGIARRRVRARYRRRVVRILGAALRVRRWTCGSPSLTVLLMAGIRAADIPARRGRAITIPADRTACPATGGRIAVTTVAAM